ncbi:Meiotic Sister-Chromatid recombination aldehyde dehydrogenase, partial [Rhizoclosmatium hyalinum]
MAITTKQFAEALRELHPQAELALVLTIALVAFYAVNRFLALFKGKPSGTSKAHLVNVPFPKESDPSWNTDNILATSAMNIRDSENPSQIKCWEPTSGRYLCSRPAFTKDQVKEAVAKARRAQQDFKNSSWQQRRDILTTLLDYLVREQSAICRISARCSGKT